MKSQENAGQAPACGCHDHKDKHALLCSVLSAILLLGILLADKCWALASFLRLLAYVFAFIPVGWPVLRKAVAEALKGEWANEYLLMSVAAAGAFCLGEYPEAVAVMLLYSIGEHCQDKAVGKARRDIRSLIGLRREQVMVVDGEHRTRKSPDKVMVGEVIEVPAGGRVPLDAVLLSEPTHVDLSALTGESLPQLVATGSSVSSGAIVLESPMLLRVVHPYADSAMSRIFRMVEQANARKAPAELFMRRFARLYTPFVMLAAVFVAFVPPLYLGFWTFWSDYLHRGLVFLVASCPCALVISIPLAYFCGIGLASRRGILFKGGNCLDAAAGVTDVVFDKTGTLTCGRFEVARVVPVNTDASSLLSLMAGLELHSTHPLARALVAYATNHNISPQSIASLREMPGMGLTAVVNNCNAAVGNARLMEKLGLEVPETDREIAGTVLYCCSGGVLQGYVVMSDRPKDDAARAIGSLRRLRVHSVSLLSGDRQAIVGKLARDLHLDAGFGDLLPQQKMEHLKSMRGRGRCVAFVGDGINDAPALASCDVGFAMGDSGSDLAVETADVVLRGGHPLHVAYAMAIARVTRRVVRANVTLALGAKLLVMCLGAAGVAGMWMAVLADSGVALLCLLVVVIVQPLLCRRSLRKLA